MTRATTALIALATSLALAPAAFSGPRTGFAAEQPAPRWATVNICSGGEIGVRASIPGHGGAGQLSARFTLEWLNPATGGWEPVAGQASSPWLSAGAADQLWGQAGYTFLLEPLSPGSSFTFRGVAEIDGGGSLVTTAGLLDVHGGTAGTSLATCTLAGPAPEPVPPPAPAPAEPPPDSGA